MGNNTDMSAIVKKILAKAAENSSSDA